MTLSAPELLADHHQTAGFSCGVPSLDERLKRIADQRMQGVWNWFVIALENLPRA